MDPKFHLIQTAFPWGTEACQTSDAQSHRVRPLGAPGETPRPPPSPEPLGPLFVLRGGQWHQASPWFLNVVAEVDTSNPRSRDSDKIGLCPIW
jgi:hypothetical protein